jgi:hypothetical protein
MDLNIKAAPLCSYFVPLWGFFNAQLSPNPYAVWITDFQEDPK